jgi:hypothetical protein
MAEMPELVSLHIAYRLPPNRLNGSAFSSSFGEMAAIQATHTAEAKDHGLL